MEEPGFTVSASPFVDTPPPGQVAFYEVTSLSGTPVIASITPPGASFGKLITIYGSGFGTDRLAVKVRFSYTEGSESLVIDQPVFETTGTSISVAVPLAVPTRVNNVQVLVGAAISLPYGYFVGALLQDPTPGDAGNETNEIIDELDLLMARVDGKLDPWFRTTETLPQFDCDTMHQALAQGRAGLTNLRSHIAAQSAGDSNILHVMDIVLASESYNVLREKLRLAAAAIEHSPIGQQMCEGRVEADYLSDVLEALDTLSRVIDIILDVIQVICTLVGILSIFTAGIATPITAILCGSAMSIVKRLLSYINETIQLTANAMRAIPLVAPTVIKADTFFANTLHQAWGFDQSVVYVDGTVPVVARSFATFHNEQCDPDGCDFFIGVEELDDDNGDPIGVQVTDIKPASDCGFGGIFCPGLIGISVPYKVVPDLRMNTTLVFEAAGGVPAFHQIPVPLATPEGDVGFTGSDVHGPSSDGWDRGFFSFDIGTPICGTTTLPSVHRTVRLVSGPRLLSVTPAAAHLGQEVTLHGTFMPPFTADDPVLAEAFFGDASGPTNQNSVADDLRVNIPDTTNAAGTIGLRVEGRNANQVLPFDVLPPVLTTTAPRPAFNGEAIELHGIGFAAAQANNSLTLNGQPLLVDRFVDPLDPSAGLVFTIPATADDGDLIQATAVGVHVSNTVALDLAEWQDSSMLSHPARDADKLSLAVHPDGTAGVAWIDRHGDGGEARVLFTDAAPGDPAFRAPIEITTDLLGRCGNLQKPDLTVAPDGTFHIVWVNGAGEIEIASFAKGAVPTGSVTVATPPVGALHEPSITATASGNLCVAYVETPLDADPNNTLFYTRSLDGGATFEPPVVLDGPALYVGEPDLTFADGNLWLAYSRNTATGNVFGRGIRSRHSDDGVSWSPPEIASPRDGADGDLPYLPFPSISNRSLQRRPTVSGDAAGGAVVAWEAPTYELNPDSDSYSTLKVCTNSEPYAIDSTLTLTPTTPDYQNDNGLPSLWHYDAGGSYKTAIAWVERIPGTSPDRVAGVPRIKFSRSTDRLVSLGIDPPLTPTVSDGDTTTVDDQPSLGIDASGNLHLAWLQGDEGERVVRYVNTSVTYGNAPADDPPMIPADACHVLTFDLVNAATEDISLNAFHGTMLYDPDVPTEFRWTAVGVRGSSFNDEVPHHLNHWKSTLTPDGDLIYYGGGDFLGPTRIGWDGRAHLYASDNYPVDVMSRLIHPYGTPDGGIVAVRPYSPDPTNQLELAIEDALPGHLTGIGASFPNPGFSSPQPAVAFDQDYAAYEENGAVVVIRLSDGVELVRFPNSSDLEWAPFSNEVLFVEHRTGGCEQDALMEYGVSGALLEHFVTDCDGEIQGPTYAPDGSDIAWACKKCGDAAADAENAMIIKTLGHGDVPREPWTSIFSPAWSPNLDRIAFFKQYAGFVMHASMRLMIWDIGAPDAVQHLGPGVGNVKLHLVITSPTTAILVVDRYPELVWRTVQP